MKGAAAAMEDPHAPETPAPATRRSGTRASARRSRSQGDQSDPERIVAAAQTLFGEKVEKMTAPGGRKRASIRVHLESRTVIATNRAAGRRRETEVKVLERLHAEGAGVPEFLGMQNDIIFQSDAGSRRLTSELLRSRAMDLDELVCRTFESLWEIKAAAKRAKLVSEVAPMATGIEWLQQFTQAPRELSRRLGIQPPRLRLAPLAQSLVTLPVEFIKWDARPGNAAVQDDGSIVWFDWEHAGRRRGVEDFAFLLGDEFWPVEPARALRLFADCAPVDPTPVLPLLRRFSTLQVAQRLRLIESQQRKHGWNREDRARRYDRIGTAPELVQRLRDHGTALAQMDPLTDPMTGWFSDVAQAILTR